MRPAILPFKREELIPYLAALRRVRPLVHCLTNEVVQEITANVLLAAGASPAMVVGEGEVSDFVRMSHALLINIGTPYEARVAVMKEAVRTAVDFSVPWVLDPVAAGATRWRDKIIFDLLECKPAAVRGNASEILALAGLTSSGKGVDSLDSSESAVDAAVALASRYETIVAVTGAKDYVTDGSRVLCAKGGSEMMTKVVGTGCSLSALTAAFIATSPDALEAAAACLTYVNLASEAAFRNAKGPGSFHAEYLDALYDIRPEDLEPDLF